MSRNDPQYRFRPPPELATQLNAYCLRERRRSVNEALIVLVSMALEHDREAREGTVVPLTGAPTRCQAAKDGHLCGLPTGHTGLHKAGCGTWL